MIKNIVLFTNRIVMAFDETGEQLPGVQTAFAESNSWNSSKVTTTLLEVKASETTIELSKWAAWSHKITFEEFCYLIGQGAWHEEQKKGGWSSLSKEKVEETNEDSD